MVIKDPVTLLQELLQENNLAVSLSQPHVRYIQDGGVVIEQPQLQVVYADASKLPKEDNEQSAEKEPAKASQK